MNNKEILNHIDSHNLKNLDDFTLEEIYSSIVLRTNSIENVLNHYFINIEDVIESESELVNEYLERIQESMIKSSHHIRNYIIDVFLRENTTSFICDIEIDKIEREKSYVNYSSRIIEEYNDIQEYLKLIYYELYSE